MMMAAFYNYVYGGEAIDLTAPAASWSFEPGTTPSPDQIRQIAKALGIAGEVRDLSADMGGGWAVGSDDYSKPSINVGPDATLGWWFNAGYDDTVSAPSCAVADPGIAADSAASDTVVVDASEATVNTGVASTGVASTGVESTDTIAVDPAVDIAPIACEQAAPPVNVPTAEEAEAKATELLTAFGLDPASYEFETYADEWSASVTAYLLLDGLRTPMPTSFGFGENGALTWAGGFLATPIRSADYPRIGVEAAVERLNEQSNGWGYGISPTARAEIDTVGEAAEGPTETITPPEFSPETVPAAVDVPSIQEPEPTDTNVAEEITVTLTDPQPSIEMLWAADGTVWLLPGYRFDSSEAGTFSVLAVEDQYIEVDEAPIEVPDTIVAPPVETTVPGSDAVECAAASDAEIAPVDDTGSALVGLCEADAAAAAEAAGFTQRVVRLDGADLPATMDYNPSRFNVAVDQGVVTEIISIG